MKCAVISKAPDTRGMTVLSYPHRHHLSLKYSAKVVNKPTVGFRTSSTPIRPSPVARPLYGAPNANSGEGLIFPFSTPKCTPRWSHSSSSRKSARLGISGYSLTTSRNGISRLA